MARAEDFQQIYVLSEKDKTGNSRWTFSLNNEQETSWLSRVFMWDEEVPGGSWETEGKVVRIYDQETLDVLYEYVEKGKLIPTDTLFNVYHINIDARKDFTVLSHPYIGGRDLIGRANEKTWDAFVSERDIGHPYSIFAIKAFLKWDDFMAMFREVFEPLYNYPILDEEVYSQLEWEEAEEEWEYQRDQILQDEIDRYLKKWLNVEDALEFFSLRKLSLGAALDRFIECYETDGDGSVSFYPLEPALDDVLMALETEPVSLSRLAGMDKEELDSLIYLSGLVEEVQRAASWLLKEDSMDNLWERYVRERALIQEIGRDKFRLSHKQSSVLIYRKGTVWLCKDYEKGDEE